MPEPAAASPRGPFTVYLVQHSHIDIGYTERQEVIAEYQRQFIGQAVRLATSPRQATRHDDVKFRFTCEGFWAVELFLKRASREERNLLLKAIDEGTMEIGATYFHLSELLDEGHLRDTLAPAIAFGKSIGRPVTWAGAFDVNGFAWGWCDALVDAGIRYFSTCINTHHGGRPFGRRNVPFHWQSPRGQKILTWEGQTYHRGNLYGIVPGSDSGSGPSFEVGDLTMAEAKLLPKIAEFRAQGIPVDYAPIFIGGLYTDNSPPSDIVCDHVAAWNAKHGGEVYVRLATMNEFFQRLEHDAARFPTVAGDWPDWWGDGTISTPLEVQLFRNAQRVKREVERLDPDHKVVSRARLDDIRQQLWLFAEHTWGYSESVPSPWDFVCQQIVMRKATFAVHADELAMTALDDVLYARGQGEFVAARPFDYKVINTLAEPVEGLALLPIDFWEASRITGGFVVEDAAGHEVPHQVSRFGRGQHVALHARLRGGEEATYRLRFDAARKADAPVVESAATSFENDALRLSWDDERGIVSLVCKATDEEMIDTAGTAFAAPIYQVFPTPEGKTPSSLRGEAGIQKIKPRGRVSPGRLTKLRRTQDGPLFSTWQFDYAVEGCSFYAVELLLPKTGAWFHVTARLNKDNVWDPEGMYLAFPFAVEGGRWKLDRAGAIVEPGVDQLPESCCDYYMVQEGAVLSGHRTGVAVAMRDTPMVHIGAMRLWDYGKRIEPVGTLYSWQTNNKWETNFKASCGGFYEFRYTVEVGPHLVDPAKAVAACHRWANPFRTVRR